MTYANLEPLTADLQQEALSPLPDPLKSLLLQGILENTTDIHIHPYQGEFRVFFRVDGRIYRKEGLSLGPGRQLLNQVRSAAKLEVAKILRPEEGQIACQEGHIRRDVRVTAIPVDNETAIHMRFLSMPEARRDLSNLGFSAEDKQQVTTAIESRQGLILVTGTTGSGKTTTLYALASELDVQRATVYAIEDPVEFRLPFAQQMEVNEAQGLTLYEGLRTILRMDPDIIMIGEIRDKDSAVAAARAALSGRLVLATIHGRNALAALEAFHYLNVPNYIIGSSIRMVIAQQLVRCLCPDCKERRTPTHEEVQLFEQYRIPAPDQVSYATGCDACNGYGYKGRTGVFDILTVDKALAETIRQGNHLLESKSQLENHRSSTYMNEALKKVKEGITSMEELFFLARQQ